MVFLGNLEIKIILSESIAFPLTCLKIHKYKHINHITTSDIFALSFRPAPTRVGQLEHFVEELVFGLEGEHPDDRLLAPFRPSPVGPHQLPALAREDHGNAVLCRRCDDLLIEVHGAVWKLENSFTFERVPLHVHRDDDHFRSAGGEGGVLTSLCGCTSGT